MDYGEGLPALFTEGGRGAIYVAAVKVPVKVIRCTIYQHS